MRSTLRLPLVAGLAWALVGLGVPAARADTTSDLSQAQSQAQLLDQVRATLGSNLADALAAQTALEQSIQQNQQQQQQLTGQISAADAKIASLDEALVRLQQQIDSTNARIQGEQEELRQLTRVLYAQPSSMLMLLAESRGLGDLLTRVSDVRVAGSRARVLSDQLQSDEVTLEQDAAKQRADRDQQAAARDKLVQDRQKLQDLEAQQEASQVALQNKIAETKGELNQVAQQSAQVAQRITDLLNEQEDEIIAAAMQQVWDQVKLLSGQLPTGQLTISATHSKDTRFIWPEKGAYITQPFGPSTLPLEPPYQSFPHFHTGIDMSLPAGAPVGAADDGIVVLVGGGQVGYGNYVVIAHAGGLTTLYGHLLTTLVKQGTIVKQGDVIGLEGSTGNSTGPHLHFELRTGQQPLDPAPYLPQPLPGNRTP